MSEHIHDWLLEGGRRYFYCECGETGPGIEDLWNERIDNQERIKALEGVVECAKKWCDKNTTWQAHLAGCIKCVEGDFCSEEWTDRAFDVLQAFKDTYFALSKLEEVGDG